MDGAGLIRLARQDEAPVLAALYRETVQVLGPALYTPEQVAAWSGFGTRVERFRALLGSTDTFVWEQERRVLGFCTVESSGYVNLLYVASSATRRGIGGRLLDHALAHVAEVHGPPIFTAHASHFSRELFARHGFVVASEEVTTYEEVSFHRFRMVREER